MSMERLPREGEEVFDANGASLGTVRQVLFQPAGSGVTNSGYHLQVEPSAGQAAQVFYLPAIAIRYVGETGVHLNVDRATIADQGWDARPDGLDRPAESEAPAAERYPGQVPEEAGEGRR
jgi:hypothetical protein